MKILLTKKLKRNLSLFLEVHSPHRVSRHLRTILFEYMKVCGRGGAPVNNHELLTAMAGVFDLLDIADRECRKVKKKKRPG